MRVLVCGSRRWDDEEAIVRRLGELPKGTTVVHGNAPGADRIADRVARKLGFDVEVYPAEWKRYGKRAGFLRNEQMLETGPRLVIAFHRDGSPGTKMTIDGAKRREIPVETFHG